MTKPIHQRELMLLVKKHVGEAADCQFLPASIPKATKCTTLSAEGLGVVIERAHSLQIVRIGVLCSAQPIHIINESEL